jgi:hypothetical protein
MLLSPKSCCGVVSGLKFHLFFSLPRARTQSSKKMLIAVLYFELTINIFMKNLHETGFNPKVAGA